MRRSVFLPGVGLVACAVISASTTGLGVASASVPSHASPAADLGVDILAVSADATDDVWALGAPGVYVRRWDGSAWNAVQASVPCTGGGGDLRGIDAESPTDVWAVGSCFDQVKAGLTRVEHWDGTRFRHVKSPNPESNEYLDAVSVLSPTDVWAAGSNADIGSTLVMRYAGTRWHVVEPPRDLAEASAITAFSDTDVWVASRNALAHWDGQHWTVHTFAGELYSISGAGPNDVWAVGRVNSTADAGRYDTYALHWDGSTWTRATLPRVPGITNYFEGVSAVTSDDVWAVGTYRKGVAGEFVEHWDGSQWIVAKVFYGDDPNDGFAARGVAALGGDDVWAVGDIKGAPSVHWDGSSWTRHAMP